MDLATSGALLSRLCREGFPTLAALGRSQVDLTHCSSTWRLESMSSAYIFSRVQKTQDPSRSLPCQTRSESPPARSQCSRDVSRILLAILSPGLMVQASETPADGVFPLSGRPGTASVRKQLRGRL